MTFGKSLGLATTLALCVACGGSEQQQQARGPETTTTTGATNAPTSTETAPTQTQPMQTPQTMQQQNMAAALSDAQIVAILDAANGGDVEQSKLALKKAKDAQVKAFAQMMVDHHGGAMNKTKQLATQFNITPESTTTSTQLQTDSQNAITQLSGQTGADFDKAYMDVQVKVHKMVLDALDTKLIPSAHNPDLKKQLTDLRPVVADHLQRAEQIQQKLGMMK